VDIAPIAKPTAATTRLAHETAAIQGATWAAIARRFQLNSPQIPAQLALETSSSSGELDSMVALTRVQVTAEQSDVRGSGSALRNSFAVTRFASRLRRMADQRVDPTVPPSGDGCVECLASGGWWFHLRRCARCGHIGCCDSSPSQHASAHAKASDHTVIRSFEPGEDWFYDYETDEGMEGPALAPPEHHPLKQPTPGPAGKVPRDWQRYLH